MTGNTIPYWHVDAFAGTPFAGNQAAVVVVDAWPDDRVMQAVAAENLFAESAFLLPSGSDAADYELRWFTPACEVALCGHATLASGHAMLEGDEARESVTFATRKSGMLEVRRDGAGGYELALPAIRVRDAVPEGMLAGLDREPEEALYDGRGYVIALYRDEATVRALDPDMAQLASHGDTMFICTARGTASDVVSRVFVPGAGVPEDSVTGSAHAALTVYWADKLGRDRFTAHQASARGGDIACRIDGDRAVLGGHCVTVVEGRFRLP
ncbi:PhzF family phenazine biosynthesis protein [Aurantiacibacter spongiae]|uniref:PhzF family phenazine biosynthesis protein n=1 Tax=Aurantiacibacter spongiae TaxID=2488860 RepID=A0A3N5CRX5_9SPHN|nr:PhzF family phenazine biosynthesis protein [Aurantiacibacter spongiae]RPF71347.1 PhzF family phenazine biosynthesis protein [Aurantiacibacter spongiae]